MQLSDLNEVLRIAKQAGDYLLSNLSRLEQRHISTKTSHQDLVTEFDKRSEELIRAELAVSFPGVKIIGEEFGGANGEENLAFHVDPIDGTTNFVHGHPYFAVSIGLVEAGEPVLGVVLAPRIGECFASMNGGKSTLNGAEIKVSSCSDLRQALLATGFACVRKDSAYRGNFEILASLVGQSHGFRRMGSAALDLCYLAAGRVDCYWEQCLSSWDTAAGVCIVRNAGGVVTDFFGSSDVLTKPTIMAAPPSLHPMLREAIAELYQGGPRS